jgi:hypothetical protein
MMFRDCNTGLEALTSLSRLALIPLVITEINKNMQFVTLFVVIAAFAAYLYSWKDEKLDKRNTSNLIGLAASMAMMTDTILFWRLPVIPIVAIVLVASLVNLIRTKSEISMRKYNG